MTKAYLIGYVAACALGYAGRIVVEWAQRRHRERVLRALGGKLPDWEVGARALEDRAHNCVLQLTDLDTATRGARMLRQEADTTRQRGRRRDREWQ